MCLCFTQEMELLSVKESDGSKVRILIKFTHEVPPMDHQFINIFNIITNQCMSLIGLHEAAQTGPRLLRHEAGAVGRPGEVSNVYIGHL